jgi:hypothetical protein
VRSSCERAVSLGAKRETAAVVGCLGTVRMRSSCERTLSL